ncbi:hypothetical protein DPU24_25540 [Salmonella enterica subsp. enterica serovar Oranienburg]|nr:hypothetical protein [Salmonella enterica subsp. enterica serovar Oranienburg]
MKLTDGWLFYIKWGLIYLVILPLLLLKFRSAELFHSHTLSVLVVTFLLWLFVTLVDRLFCYLIQQNGEQKHH